MLFRSLALMALLWPASRAAAQGATTGAVTGVVTNDQQQPVAGASIIAIHLPSGTTYETTTRADGRYSILGMRVGGPYSITVAYVQGGGAAFQPKTEDNITVNLGAGTEVPITVQGISVQEKVEVVANIDPVFSSTRTGAATAITRADLAELPTVSGRLGDLTRLTPQASSNSSFAGQDGRVNNMTVDGAADRKSTRLNSSH